MNSYNSILKGVVFLCCFSFLTQSCTDSTSGIKNKKNDLIEIPEPELPTLKNNTLSFSGGDNFTGFLRKINTLPDYELDQYMAKTVGFRSLHKFQNDALAKSGDEQVNDDSVFVDDPYFASILNKDGVVEINDIVYDIDRDFVYIHKNWDAYNSFVKPVESTSRAKNTLMRCPEEQINEPQQVGPETYQISVIDPCDPPSLPPPPPGDGDNGGDDNGDGTVTDYPSKKIVKYRSGGRDGRLKGKSWNVNYYVYSSVGAKSVHARQYTFAGVWWRKPADYIRLKSEIAYKYGESSMDLNSIKVVFSYDIGTFANYAVDNLVARISGMSIGGTLFDTLTDQLDGTKYKITVKKISWNNHDVDVLAYRKVYDHDKRDAKTVSKVFDWATSPNLINYPPTPPSSTTKFNVSLLESFHELTHDGHHIEFKTDKRK